MCGRFALYSEPSAMAQYLDAVVGPEVLSTWRPKWNVAPTCSIMGVVHQSEERTLRLFRWGLVPSWAKDPSVGNSAFNARAETVDRKPMFRSAFRRSRILLPADDFYEWKAGSPKQPYAFTRGDGQPTVFAGLSERWQDAEGSVLHTATILTTEAGPDMPFHHRQPVVLEPETWDIWLDKDVTGGDELVELLRPTASGTLVHRPVRRDVGNVRNDGPRLLETVIAEE